jgi:hypothetical protein
MLNSDELNAIAIEAFKGACEILLLIENNNYAISSDLVSTLEAAQKQLTEALLSKAH